MDSKMVYAFSGFVIGAAAGIFAAKTYYQKKYTEEAEKEIDEMRRYTNEKVRMMRDEARENDIVNDMDRNEVEPEAYSSTYESYSSRYVSKDNDEHPEDDIPTDPFEIFEEEYESGEEEYYDKAELFLYLDDEVLADDADDVVYPDETIGLDNFEKFLSNDREKTIYIRNPRTDTDYEVTKVTASYKESIGEGDL